MTSKAAATCTECGCALNPFDETCPECGELTPLGVEKERAARREAGLAEVQAVTPRIVAIVLLFVLAAGLVYIYVYRPQLAALLQNIVQQFKPG